MDNAPPRKPARKPVQAEHAQRVASAMEMLLEGKSDGQVKRAVAERFGLSPRTVERYLRRAREKMVESTGKPADALRAEALAVYQTIIDDPEAENRDRIKARERIDKLLGLEIHHSFAGKLEVSGPDGAPIQHQATVVTVDLGTKLAEFAGSIRAAAHANAIECAGT